MLRFAATLTLLSLLNVLAYAQGGASSSLSGVVTDTAGELIAGADVTVKSRTTGAEFKATTSGNGTFLVPALDPEPTP
jgi:hypothetical protein